MKELDRNTMDEVGIINWGNSGMNARTWIEERKKQGYIVLIHVEEAYASLFKPRQK